MIPIWLSATGGASLKATVPLKIKKKIEWAIETIAYFLKNPIYSCLKDNGLLSLPAIKFFSGRKPANISHGLILIQAFGTTKGYVCLITK